MSEIKYYYIVFHHSKGLGYIARPIEGEMNLAEITEHISKEKGEDCMITNWKEITISQHSQLLKRFPKRNSLFGDNP